MFANTHMKLTGACNDHLQVVECTQTYTFQRINYLLMHPLYFVVQMWSTVHSKPDPSSQKPTKKLGKYPLSFPRELCSLVQFDFNPFMGLFNGCYMRRYPIYWQLQFRKSLTVTIAAENTSACKLQRSHYARLLLQDTFANSQRTLQKTPSEHYLCFSTANMPQERHKLIKTQSMPTLTRRTFQHTTAAVFEGSSKNIQLFRDSHKNKWFSFGFIDFVLCSTFESEQSSNIANTITTKQQQVRASRWLPTAQDQNNNNVKTASVCDQYLHPTVIKTLKMLQHFSLSNDNR